MKSTSNLYEFASKNKTLTAITIELNTNCNWRCKHCYIDDYSYEYELSFNVIKRLFIEMRKMGVVDLLFTGGEMFLRKDILEIIKLARSMFFDVSLFTNASLLNESVIKSLKCLYIDHISCTLFSLDDSIHDSITGVNGSLQKTMENLKLLKQYNIDVEVKHIITNLNMHEHKRIVEYCTSMGFKYRLTPSIWSKKDGDHSPLNLKVDETYLRKNLIEIDELRSSSKIVKHENLFVCNATRYSLFIMANGDVTPCTNLYKSIGNISENSLKDIWKSSEYLNKVQNLKWKNLHVCKNCEVSDFCMRCSGIALLEHGDLLSCNRYERINATIRKEYYSKGRRRHNGKICSTIC
jgi:radical SAM protein with 4Fe4S-binding SPASM domain